MLRSIKRSVNNALEEDVGPGDVTASLFNVNNGYKTNVTCREDAILCGQCWFNETFRQLDPNTEINWLVNDGNQVGKDSIICSLQGTVPAILTGERVALNFLQTLSATATYTHAFVDRVAGTTAQILDTRKTLPGMRYAQKYAVLCGGGMNHRMGLYDVILIKENHIAAAGSIKKAAAIAKQKFPELKLEIEIETNQQLKEAINTEADIILLDNFSLSELVDAVNLNDNRKKLEASGNISLDNIREIAKTGVDFISIGAITKHIQAIDFSMKFE
jgi:nicotinate-nucleotide pyrophosphorylase (carboxylating)